MFLGGRRTKEERLPDGTHTNSSRVHNILVDRSNEDED